MKRVGIITIHRSPSFGASLQSFALFRYIQQQGFDCELINLYRPANPGYEPSIRYKSYKEQNLSFLKKQKKLMRSIFGMNRKPARAWSHVSRQKFDEFNAQIKFSQAYPKVDDLYDNPPDYDVYVSGSDQLWNPDQPFCIEPYFLTFVKNGGRKISYASSIGLSCLPQKVKEDFSRWLYDFDAISVREHSAKKIVEELAGKKVVEVLDPTFLLTPEEWMDQIVEPSDKGYVLLFTLSLNENLKRMATYYAQTRGYQVVGIGNWDTSESGLIKMDDVGPKEFLGYIKHADAVFTDSFHGTVFSIILGARQLFPYISQTSKRGSRIIDLLCLFHLEARLIDESVSNEASVFNLPDIERKAILNMLQEKLTVSKHYINAYIR